MSSIGFHHTEESKAKISRTLMGHLTSEETRAKISRSNSGKTHTEEVKAKLHQMNLGKTLTEEAKAKIGKANKVCMKSLWEGFEFKDNRVRAIRLGCCVHPNKPEALLLELLESIDPGEWKFVGDGEFIIAGKKQIIELFGDYWHKGENPQERIDLFRQYGYKTLIIWENELKEPERVLGKIARMEG